MASEPLRINGYGGHGFAARLQRHGGSELAVFLPGLGYRNSRPGLCFPQLLMRQRDADILTIDYEYDRNDVFLRATEAEQLEWIGADAKAALTAALDCGKHERYTIFGKSLGTIGMGWALPTLPRLADARLVWLTPSVVDTGLAQRMQHMRHKSLVVIGTLDPGFSKQLIDMLRRASCTVIVLEGADHRLECPDDARASVNALSYMLRHMEEWLQDGEH